jgi:sugar O-acyltransferase (sialic acid O-acetyltransferase NeuD family)
MVGAGGFGREALDVIVAINALASTFDVLGVLDDAPSEVNLKRLAARDIPFLGPVEGWLRHGEDATYIVGVGDPRARRRIVNLFDAHDRSAATLVHPSAAVGSMTTLSPGVVICSGAQVSTNVRLGRHVHVNPNATVGHDSVVGDFSSINPLAAIAGDCTIGSDVLFGTSSAILQGLSVGAGATIGAAACVVRDVGEGTTVKGVPAQ